MMPTSRADFRYRVDLHAWLHAGATDPMSARVIDLSRTGACLQLPARMADAFRVGATVCLALDDATGGRTLVGRRFGRVAHADSGGDGALRMGLAFGDGRGLLPATLLSELSPRVEDARVSPRAGANAMVVGAAGLLLDQASKGWAWLAAPTIDQVVDLAPGFLTIAPVANHGALANFAGSYSGTSLACALASLALAAMAPGWAARGRASALGAGLIAAGLLGNAGDRLALGFVRDFLASPHLPGWTFNLADLFLLVGAGVLAAPAPRRLDDR